MFEPQSFSDCSIQRAISCHKQYLATVSVCPLAGNGSEDSHCRVGCDLSTKGLSTTNGAMLDARKLRE